MTIKLDPANELMGSRCDRWTIEERLDTRDDRTAGAFSVGYIARSENGDRVFVKALRLPFAGVGGAQVDLLASVLEQYRFERDVARACANRKMTRVVRTLYDGQIRVETQIGPIDVPVIVFELADGDIRDALDEVRREDAGWALRTAHQVAIGLFQLHQADIAHQDLKPANVLVFSEGVGSKVGDLGRAAMRGRAAPHEALAVAGDRRHAAPERLFKWEDTDWGRRRIGSDVFALGSLLTFMFARVSMTALLQKHLLPLGVDWRYWGGTFEEALPFLERAYADALEELQGQLPVAIRSELLELIRGLCAPDPRRRGDPRSARTVGKPLALESCVSRLNRLARKMERAERVSR